LVGGWLRVDFVAGALVIAALTKPSRTATVAFTNVHQQIASVALDGRAVAGPGAIDALTAPAW